MVAEVIKVLQSIIIKSSVFWPLGPIIKSALWSDSVRIVNKSFLSYLPLEAHGFYVSEKAS